MVGSIASVSIVAKIGMKATFIIGGLNLGAVVLC